jgi:hypothetical protein
LLAACALFIGGNSGPKHIAAASGVPTIGIHSGVVDPGEWGPIGERTVALYRDMSCAPCFLAKPEHCPRGLACVEMLDPPLVHKMAQMFLARPVVPRIAPSDAAPWQGPDAAARYVAALLTLGAASGPREVSERVSPPVKSGKPASTVPKEAVIPGRQSRKRVLPMGGPK